MITDFTADSGHGGDPINFYATLHGVTSPYSYTLDNGQGSKVTGTNNSTSFYETLIARASHTQGYAQTYTLTVIGSNQVTGTAQTGSNIFSDPPVPDGPACTNFVNRNSSNAVFGGDNVYGVFALGEQVYVATTGGLSISQDGGLSFNTNKTTDQGLADNFVRGVYAQGNTVYAATNGGLSISYDRGASFSILTTNQSLASDVVNGVYAVGQTIYAATDYGLRISYDGGRSFVHRTTDQGLGQNRVNGVYAVDNIVYAATAGGLSISYDRGQTFHTEDTDYALGVYAVGTTVYVATNQGLKISYNSGASFVTRSTDQGLGSNFVQGVFAQGQTVYVATADGLGISINGGQSFSNYTPARSSAFGKSFVKSVFALGERLYVATLEGLYRCPPPPVPTLTNLSASPNPVVAGQPITFSAMVGAVTGNYAYTLTNGMGSHVTGTSSSPTFSQTLTAHGAGIQTYSLTVEKDGVQASTSIPVTVQPVVITKLSASPNPVLTGHPITLNATVGNVTGAYNFTLGNGIDTPLSGTASGAVFSQTLTAHGFGAQTYTLTVAVNDNRTTATVPVTVLPRPIPITGLSASPNPVVAGQHITFSATVDNQSQPYHYTLANGLGSTRTGTLSNGAFSQPLIARGAGPQTYTLAVTTEDGLGISTVTLTVTPGPAVANGPACTDFINRTTANAGLGSDHINGVYAVGNTVYAATNNGLSISTNGGNLFYTRHQGLGSDQVHGVYVQGDTVYAATEGGLSISIDKGLTFTNKTTDQGLGSNRVRGVYAVGNTVYAATAYGLSISTDGGQSFVNRIEGIGSFDVMGVYAVDNIVYAATNGGGLGISYDGGQTFTNQDLSHGLGSNDVNGVYAQGLTVYLATGDGLKISQDGGRSFVTRSTAESLGDRLVLGVYAVGQTIYAATASGLSISIDGGQRFTNYIPANTDPGLGDAAVWNVYALGERLYMATERGLSICPPLTPPTLTSLSASFNPVTVGQPITFTATVGGVTGPYSYTLSNGVDTPLSSTASGAFSQSLTAQGSGPQTFTLTVATEGGIATATTSLTVLAQPITLMGLAASPNLVVSGQPVQFTATVANFKRGYSYALTNGLGSILTGTADTSPFSQSLTARGSGPQTFTLTVTPFDEPTSISATVELTVSPGPAVADGPVCTDFVNRPLPNASPVTGVYAVGSTVYAATENGLAISTDGGNSFPTIRTTANGLGANQVNAVFAVGDTVYAATDGGLSISIDGDQTFVNHITGLSNNQVRAVYVVNNTIYVATRGGLGISTDGGQTFAIRTSVNGLGEILVNGVSVVDKTVYAATNNGLSISTNGGSSFAVNRTTASPSGIASNVVLGVYAIGLSVYVATDNGMSISTDGGQTFANRTTGNKLGSNNVHAVYAVGNTVYAATNNGLSISIDGGQTFTNYTTANTSNGLGSDIVAGVSVAGERIYAATRGGVSFCPPPVVNPILTNLSASPNPVQAGQPTTFTATVGGVAGAYSYTLGNGVTPPLSGTASGTVFSQSLSAQGSGLQTYTLTVTSPGGVATATIALTVLSSGVTITNLQPDRMQVRAGQSVAFTATLTGLVDGDHYSYTLTNGQEAFPLTGDDNRANFEQDVTVQGSGPQTFTLTLSSDKGRATATASIFVTREELFLLSFAIGSVTPVSCVTTGGNERRVSFLPQYVGTNGEPISFSVVNELATTTQPGPYTLRLYTDNPTITLSAQQGGRGEVRFVYNWLAACQGAPTPPQAPTTTGIPSQTLLVGQPYQLTLTDYVTDPDGQTPLFRAKGLPAGLSLSETVISGTPATTGTYPVSLTATDPGGLSITVGFTLTVIPVSSSPSVFTIVGVTPVSCALADSLKQGYRVRFMPKYGGVTGNPISFSVVNEFLPTLSVGPYTLNLYADNPVITLKASQQGSPGDASFSYNWLAACRAQTPVNPGSFALAGVTTVRCEMVSSGQRRVSFTPQYAGLDGSPVSFSVVNEKLPTTEKGPYSLNLYTDNSTITLSAQQGSQVATYIYHWLTACQAPARLGAGEPEEGLQVRVLGNPVEGGQARLEIRGAAGQRIDLQLVDLQGRLLHTQRLEATGSPEPVTVPVGPGRGALLLEVRTRTERQQIKLIKSD